MEKVLIVGSPGAGKSTFARALATLTRLPIYYLDMLWHRPDRSHVSFEEFDEALEKILELERWIIDGNYLRTLHRRLLHCDTVFFLDYPSQLCLAGAEERVGQQREDLPWAEETLDPDFAAYIRNFPVIKRPLLVLMLMEHDGKVIHFTSRQEASAWLDAFALTTK